MKQRNYFSLYITATFLLLAFVICSVQAAPSQRGAEWYLRLIVQSPSGDLRDSNNVLGQLFDSVDGYDSHDLRELAPFAAPYLTIVFPHVDWVGHEDNYTSDYHAVKWQETDQWVFQVKSDDPWLDVDLYWGNVRVLQQGDVTSEELLEKMFLEDLDTGELIKIVEDGVSVMSYLFNMDGKTIRTFRWILKGKEDKGGGKVINKSDYMLTNESWTVGPGCIDDPDKRLPKKCSPDLL